MRVIKKYKFSKFKQELLSDYIEEYIEKYPDLNLNDVTEISQTVFFTYNDIDSSPEALQFIRDIVTKKLIQRENRKKIKENFKKKKEQKKIESEIDRNIKLIDVSFLYNPNNLTYAYNNYGMQRYNFFNVEFHSINRIGNGNSIIRFIANNRNKPFGINYQKGQFVFSIDKEELLLGCKKSKEKWEEDEDEFRLGSKELNNAWDGDEIFGNPKNKMTFTYQGQMKILSSASGILYEFIGKPENKCFIEYIREMEEEIKMKMKELEEKERLEKRGIKRRFIF